MPNLERFLNAQSGSVWASNESGSTYEEAKAYIEHPVLRDLKARYCW